MASLAGHLSLECEGDFPHLEQTELLVIWYWEALCCGCCLDCFIIESTLTGLVAPDWLLLSHKFNCCCLMASLCRARMTAFLRVSTESVCSFLDSFASRSPTTMRSRISCHVDRHTHKIQLISVNQL